MRRSAVRCGYRLAGRDAGVELTAQRVGHERDVDDMAELVQDDRVALAHAVARDHGRQVDRDVVVAAVEVRQPDRVTRGSSKWTVTSPSTSATSRCASGRADATTPMKMRWSREAVPGAKRNVAARCSGLSSATCAPSAATRSRRYRVPVVDDRVPRRRRRCLPHAEQSADREEAADRCPGGGRHPRPIGIGLRRGERRPRD